MGRRGHGQIGHPRLDAHQRDVDVVGRCRGTRNHIAQAVLNKVVGLDASIGDRAVAVGSLPGGDVVVTADVGLHRREDIACLHARQGISRQRGRRRCCHAHLRHRRAILEGIVVDVRQRAGQIDILQVGTASKGIGGDFLHAPAQAHTLQRGHVLEGLTADRGHAILPAVVGHTTGNRDVGQAVIATIIGAIAHPAGAVVGLFIGLIIDIAHLEISTGIH